jgi:hypothetical protein
MSAKLNQLPMPDNTSLQTDQEQIVSIMEKHLSNADLSNEPAIYKCMEEYAALKIEERDKKIEELIKHIEGLKDYWGGFDFACKLLDEMYAKDHPHLYNIADCLRAKVNRLPANKIRPNENQSSKESKKGENT